LPPASTPPHTSGAITHKRKQNSGRAEFFALPHLPDVSSIDALHYN
jgi:hypothetical protein